jgi:L,D-transpeptidase ErfK/SrfK
LFLYSPRRLVHSWPVATGRPQYPTPLGNYTIVTKQKDPTWTPPDSDWAKGEDPIGPGSDNPLGTRWMGLSAGGIGIHGTPNPASVGYSASHGCIRMKIPDVEKLFGMVPVGTPVHIVK